MPFLHFHACLYFVTYNVVNNTQNVSLLNMQHVNINPLTPLTT